MTDRLDIMHGCHAPHEWRCGDAQDMADLFAEKISDRAQEHCDPLPQERAKRRRKSSPERRELHAQRAAQQSSDQFPLQRLETVDHVEGRIDARLKAKSETRNLTLPDDVTAEKSAAVTSDYPTTNQPTEGNNMPDTLSTEAAAGTLEGSDANQAALEERFQNLYLVLMEKQVSFKEAVEPFKTDNQNAGKG